MKLAHLILVHNAPNQLERLIRRLTYPGDAVFIHLDIKADINAFSQVQNMPNVFFIRKRINVTWGGSSMIDATINSFREILNADTRYDYINLLSSTDYPLKSPQSLHNFLDAHPQKTFMTYLRFEDEWQEAIPRITEYHLTEYTFPGRYAVQKLLNKLLPKRKMPNGLLPVGRSQWFTASIDCIAFIIDYWNKNASLRRFTRLTWGSDEFIFQTILYNSAHRECLVNNNLRYIDWSDKEANPKTMYMQDMEAMVASGQFFARKFDMKNHPDVMDAIDKRLEAVTV